MKNLIGLGMIALAISACNGGMASNGSDEINAKIAEELRIKDSLTLDSFRQVEFEKEMALEEKREAEQRATLVSNDQPISTASNTSTYQDAPAETKKTGWSDAAKGTAIGAGVGAGVGALIDKDKRVRGALIGAAIGGGSGYVIGRKSDRESGRVQEK